MQHVFKLGLTDFGETQDGRQSQDIEEDRLKE